MEIIIKRTDDMLEIECLGHTKTEYCNAISCLMWSFLAWSVNYAEEEHSFKSGKSRIKVKSNKTDVFDFMETAIQQIAYNNSEIAIKRGK